MRQEAAEQSGPFAGAIRQDARHQAFVIVIEHRERHTPEEGEGMNMSVDPGLRRRRRIGPDVTRIALRQVEGEEMRLLLDAPDADHRLAEVGLRMSRRVCQRHEHLAASPFLLAQVILDDRVATGEPMLITQPFENPFGRMALLAVPALILGERGIDDLDKPVQLRPLDRRLAPVSRRHRETQHLPDAVA